MNATFAVTKRGTPTITFYDPYLGTSGTISGYSSGTGYTVSSYAGAGYTNAAEYITTSSSPSTSEISVFHFTASAEI
jgi:hypothetical protein